MKISYTEIGKRIKTIRTNKKMTQEQLAAKIDLSLTHISNIENARTNMSIDSLVNIANALEVSTDELLFGKPTFTTDLLYADYVDLMLDCSEKEQKIILETSRALKKSIKSDF